MKVKSHHDIVLKEKDGQIIFDVRDVTVTFDVSNLKMRLNNLYNGRKALGEFRNTYLIRIFCCDDQHFFCEKIVLSSTGRRTNLSTLSITFLGIDRPFPPYSSPVASLVLTDSSQLTYDSQHLEDSTNSYINANWRAVSESLKPILEKTCSDVVFTIMKNLFDNTPAHWYIGDAGVE
uniref:Uncharacterized protein n=1 Tax=Timema douglasi TaxID=61478 RepID=A0A7R8VLG2_TIMDO|nr:unnamed protein product [Timema douglasi]